MRIMFRKEAFTALTPGPSYLLGTTLLKGEGSWPNALIGEKCSGFHIAKISVTHVGFVGSVSSSARPGRLPVS